ncbi:MAG: hypothetical protein EOP24_39835 [Hyphomicrobiales bacterium]|nr:MAG: hypothetical protein EOP24_39835 [Hyphomicrobiales bacterium]
MIFALEMPVKLIARPDPPHSPATDWINEMAARLAHLKDAPDADVWEAILPLFPEVYGSPCDRTNGYHIALAGAVVAAVLSKSHRPQ